MSIELINQPIVWVDNNEQLEELCDKWLDEPMLAVDTEFMRSQTYYPIAGLIQLNDGKANYLIDPQAITDFFPLVDVFDNKECLIFLHSCSEDLEVFQHTLGCIPHRIIDTQIACALSGYGFSVGYANAIHTTLGIDLPKGETRSDWLKRPLSQAQLAYAALDVEYLYKLALKLKADLTESGRWQWLLADCDELADNYRANQMPELTYLRVKMAWRLSGRQLAILKALCEWRETKAQVRDVPRNRIIKEHALMEIAKRQPTHISQLRNIEGITERMINSDGSAWLTLIEAATSLSKEALPNVLPQPLTSGQNKILKRLRQAVECEAEKQGIPIELIVKKKNYEAMVRRLCSGKTVNLSEHLIGWRLTLVSTALNAQSHSIDLHALEDK